MTAGERRARYQERHGPRLREEAITKARAARSERAAYVAAYKRAGPLRRRLCQLPHTPPPTRLPDRLGAEPARLILTDLYRRQLKARAA